MAWVYIDALGGHGGEEVTLRGWLYNRRSSGKVHFLLIRDGTGICQCVASVKDVGAEAFAAADHLAQGEAAYEETVRRAKRYRDAGADSIFIPMAVGENDLARFVKTIDAPLNVLAWKGLPPAARLRPRTGGNGRACGPILNPCNRRD